MSKSGLIAQPNKNSWIVICLIRYLSFDYNFSRLSGLEILHASYLREAEGMCV